MKWNASKYQASHRYDTTFLLQKHCYFHYWRSGNAWCCRRRQNEIREAHSKCMQKSLQQIAVLKRMKKIPPFETRKCLYIGFLFPHFNYCSETWHFCNKNITTKLEKVNERALRFVVNEKQTSHCELLDTRLTITCKAAPRKKIVCTVFKAINSDHAPKSIKELIPHRNSYYDLRGNDILKLPRANTTTYGLKSWRFTALKLWNSIPDFFRTIRSFKVVKNIIRKLDLSGLIQS